MTAKEGITTYIQNQPNTIKFTTNSAVNFVAASMVGNPHLGAEPTFFPYFPKGENVTLEALSVRLPYCFGQAESLIVIGFEFINRGGLITGNLDEVGNLGSIALPYANSESELDIYIPMPETIPDEDWSIRIKDIALDISMINMPADLDALELDVYVCAKVHLTNNMLT